MAYKSIVVGGSVEYWVKGAALRNNISAFPEGSLMPKGQGKILCHLSPEAKELALNYIALKRELSLGHAAAKKEGEEAHCSFDIQYSAIGRPAIHALERLLAAQMSVDAIAAGVDLMRFAALSMGEGEVVIGATENDIAKQTLGEAFELLNGLLVDDD